MGRTNTLFRLAAASSIFFIAWPGHAWFNGGHMVVAYIAYQKLDPNIRSRVDDLLKLNPLYDKWTTGVAEEQKGQTAFVAAATWADCIKEKSCSPGYTSDGGNNPPGKSTDGQNIGYKDLLMHKYWHFVDTPYNAGATGHQPSVPNAETQITIFIRAIGGSETDDVKSYDVVWLEHLVGDVHQPLHSTSRFTKNHPSGDAGGNLLYFCAKPCTDELHAYWDGLLGDTPTIAVVSQTGDTLLAAAKPKGADDVTPQSWIKGSFKLAKTKVYVKPIGKDNDPKTKISDRPDTAYQTSATAVSHAQVTLAGYRLAALLNKNLK